jgi:hypothetical protein
LNLQEREAGLSVVKRIDNKKIEEALPSFLNAIGPLDLDARALHEELSPWCLENQEPGHLRVIARKGTHIDDIEAVLVT